jgi:hypothetical protein
VEQRDPGRAIRIVLDGGNLGRNAILIPVEIDDPILPLVPATAMTAGNLTLVVSTTILLQRTQQTFLWCRIRR